MIHIFIYDFDALSLQITVGFESLFLLCSMFAFCVPAFGSFLCFVLCSFHLYIVPVPCFGLQVFGFHFIYVLNSLGVTAARCRALRALTHAARAARVHAIPQ